jgi:hypothetical protein
MVERCADCGFDRRGQAEGRLDSALHDGRRRFAADCTTALAGLVVSARTRRSAWRQPAGRQRVANSPSLAPLPEHDGVVGRSRNRSADTRRRGGRTRRPFHSGGQCLEAIREQLHTTMWTAGIRVTRQAPPARPQPRCAATAGKLCADRGARRVGAGLARWLLLSNLVS